jgi:hypothetical protein
LRAERLYIADTDLGFGHGLLLFLLFVLGFAGLFLDVRAALT